VPRPSNRRLFCNTPRRLQSATTLFRFLPGRSGGSWEEVSSNAAPQLYDAHEDSNARSPEWHLEVEGAQVKAEADLLHRACSAALKGHTAAG
jgi:hypothetical protein